MKVKNWSYKKIIKECLINEVFDVPFNNLSKTDDNTYIVDENGIGIKYTFRGRYDSEIIPKNYVKNDIGLFYEISWDWVKDVLEELKTTTNWIRSTSTSFKVLDDFIRNEDPKVIMFSTTEKTFNIYNNDLFINHLTNIFGQKYYITKEQNGDVLRVFLIRKDISHYADDMINKTYQQNGGDINEIRKRILYPNKRYFKGIRRNSLIKEQIKRILLKKRYL